MRKGFLITLSALLLFMVSLLFVQSSQKTMRDAERTIGDTVAMDSAAYAFDNAAYDLKDMLGPEVGITRNSSETNITFGEQLPGSSAYSSLLSNYSIFIANYSGGINSNVSLNFSGILNGTLLVFSNGLRYDRNMTAVRFYSPNAGTNASAYELNISSNAYRQSENISSLPQSGTVRLVVHYSDLSGSMDVSGWFDPNSLAVYTVNYSDSVSSLSIRAGNFSGGSSSIGVEQAGSVQVGLNLTTRGGWNGSLAYAYNANMSYTQLNATKNDLLWVERH